MCWNCWPFASWFSNTQSQASTILCSRCLKIFAQGIVYDDGVNVVRAHPSTAAIRSEASDGCQLCALLETSFYNEGPDAPMNYSLCGDSQLFELGFSNVNGLTRRFVLRWRSEAPKMAFPNVKLGRSATSSSSSTSLSIAKEWYADCVENHASCRSVNPGETSRRSWNPTRLLDVGHVKRDSHVRSTHTIEFPDAVAYTALSHCWGDYQHLRLLDSNLQSLQKCLDVEDLSKIFCDAITITRSLGIRYLWIDSLCIIQDAYEDWCAESDIMDKLYRFCDCCIAASAARDGRSGCFVQRDLRPL